jgi:hypothetical protein
MTDADFPLGFYDMHEFGLIEALLGRRFRFEREGVAMTRQLFLTVIRKKFPGPVSAFGGFIRYSAD